LLRLMMTLAGALTVSGCSSKAIEEASCTAEELADLQDTCLSYGGTFSATTSASGIDECDVSVGWNGESGACRLEGEGNCSITCTMPEGSADADTDGVPVGADCDDNNPDSTVVAEDGDCDGLITAEDCDDADGASSAIADDADCDGTLTEDDCDDNDSRSTILRDDQDCDGIIYGEDCDDSDSSSTTIAQDGDCDGTLTEDDCDDNDSRSTILRDDQDCDGIIYGEDCDDSDPGSTTIVQDGDCDGVPTGDDCNDSSPTSTVKAEDNDCDGTETASDCDDSDPTSTTVTTDSDCDNIESTEDCNDSDPTIVERTSYDIDDSDCDGVSNHAGGGTLIQVDYGTFDIGCTPGQTDCGDDESPVMPVSLTHSFFIGQTEITQTEYLNLTSTNPSYFTACGLACPVEQVSWHMAAAYANLLSAASGLTECYTCSGTGVSLTCAGAIDPYLCDGYRLPTEAEWEVAARCGQDLLYSGSNSINTVAWNASNAGSTTHPVRSLSQNACDIYDMSGNTWEWTDDWYSSTYYQSTVRTDPTGASTGSFKVYRGGSWYDQATKNRLADRNSDAPEKFNNNIGFRVARTIP
jgi:formylglycine-generating enzyme required for sulfatase activity